MPKISIVVPVYNVEQFLRKCLDNILAQTFQDFEVVLVDDGSTDNSGHICREYAEKDSRIVIIEKKNGGLSSARNAGLDAAKGEYIGFVDSDDYIAPDMYEFLYNNLVKYKADISICSFYLVYPDRRILHTKSDNICRCMNNEEAIRSLLSMKQFENHVCDKLFNKVLFEQLRFPENELFEDIAIIYKLLDKSKTVIYESKPKYYYVQRAGSIVNSGFNLKKMQFTEQCRKLIDFSKSKGGLYDKESQAYFALCSLWLLYEAGMHKNKYPQILDKLKSDILVYYSVVMKSRSVRIYDRFSIYLLKQGIRITFICRLHLILKNLYTGLRDYLYKIKNLSIRNMKVEGA